MDFTLFIIAQAVGFVSLVLYCTSLQARARKTLITMLTFVNILNSAVYFLLGSVTGGIMSIIGIIKLIIFQIYDTKKRNCPVWVMLIFMLAIGVNAVLTYSGWYDVFAIAEAIVVTYGAWQKNMSITRIGYFISGVLLIVFNLCVCAYTNALSESIGLIFSVIGIVRLDVIPSIKRKKHIEMLKDLIPQNPIVYNVTLLDLQAQLKKGKYYARGRYKTSKSAAPVKEFDPKTIDALVKSGAAIKQNAYTLRDAVINSTAPIVLTSDKHSDSEQPVELQPSLAPQPVVESPQPVETQSTETQSTEIQQSKKTTPRTPKSSTKPAAAAKPRAAVRRTTSTESVAQSDSAASTRKTTCSPKPASARANSTAAAEDAPKPLRTPKTTTKLNAAAADLAAAKSSASTKSAGKSEDDPSKAVPKCTNKTTTISSKNGKK